MLATACHGALALAAIFVLWRFARYLILPLVLLAVVLVTITPVGRTLLGL